MPVRQNSTQSELIALYNVRTGRALRAPAEDATKLAMDPAMVLKQLDLAIPKERKVHVVDEAAGDLVFLVPPGISAARRRQGFRDTPAAPAAQSEFVLAVGSTVHHYTGSIWPVGYKGNDRFDFSIPDGSKLLEVILLADPESVHRGVRVSARPDDGSGAGSYSVNTHWWINAYQELYYSLLVHIAPNAAREGAGQLGGQYEISGFMHTSTNWEPLAPEPLSGSETQILFTQLE